MVSTDYYVTFKTLCISTQHNLKSKQGTVKELIALQMCLREYRVDLVVVEV